MKRSISVCILLGVASLAASCSDDTSTTTSSTAATIVSSPATTTTDVSTTSSTIAATTTTASTTSNPATTSVAIDTPTTTAVTSIAADDWEALLEELDRRVVGLYEHPDLARIEDYCASGSDCASGLETQLTDAINKGQHIEGQHPFDVVEVTHASVNEPTDAGPRVATVEFVVGPDTPPAARLVDAAGNVIDTLSVTTTASRGRFTLVSVDDPTLPWRVLLGENIGPVA